VFRPVRRLFALPGDRCLQLVRLGFQLVRDLMEPAGNPRTGMAGESAQLDGIFPEKGDMT